MLFDAEYEVKKVRFWKVNFESILKSLDDLFTKFFGSSPHYIISKAYYDI